MQKSLVAPDPRAAGSGLGEMTMAKLVITRGIPGSGKTTLAKAWVAEAPDRRGRVNRDDLRDMLHGCRLGTIEQEQAVTALQQAAVRALLAAGMSVVCDDTNLVTKFARQFATVAAELGAEFEVWDLTEVPLDECLRRDAARAAAGQRAVGADVIRTMWDRHVRQLRGRGFPTVEPFPPADKPDLTGVRPYEQPEPGMVPDAVLVDLDGTAALMGDRGPYDWHRVAGDAVNAPVQRAVLAMARDGLEVIFMSGRDEVCRPDTEKWLRQHFPELVIPVLDAPLLFMRPKGDQRKDWIVKQELFGQHVAGRWRITGVFDDRGQVVRMWRAMGLTVFQVAEGDF